MQASIVLALLALATLAVVAWGRVPRARKGSVVRIADTRVAVALTVAPAVPFMVAPLRCGGCICGWSSAVPPVSWLVLFGSLAGLMIVLARAQGDAVVAAWHQARGRWVARTPVDYGLGEDWVWSKPAGAPFRGVPIEHRVSRGSPRVAAEALVGNVLLAVLASALVVLACWVSSEMFPPHGNTAQSAKLSAIQFRQSVLTYNQVHGAGCPSVVDLKLAHEIDESTFIVSCYGEEVSVRSAGPDERFATDDDIVVPPPRAEARQAR